MPLLIAGILFTFLMGTITVFGYRRYARAGRVLDRLGTPAAGAVTELIEAPASNEPGLLAKLTRQVGEKLPVSEQDASLTSRYMVAAGFRNESAVRFYYGIKVILCVVLLILAFLVRDTITSNGILRIVLVFAAGLAGYFGPGLVLDKMVSARQERIRLSMPDALDLLVVCVEAGLGLDQAIRNVADELRMTHKDISEEFGLVNLEMRAGKRRADALRNLAERVGEAELKKLLALHSRRDELMLVGHAPDIPAALHSLSGAVTKFKEGAAALLTVDELDKDPVGTLLWLIPPEMWTAGQVDIAAP